MSYAEVTVITDGALDFVETFHDETWMNAWLEEMVEEAIGDGYRCEIYVLFHEHEHGNDCECAQYETDHHPHILVNGEPGERGRWETHPILPE